MGSVSPESLLNGERPQARRRFVSFLDNHTNLAALWLNEHFFGQQAICRRLAASSAPPPRPVPPPTSAPDARADIGQPRHLTGTNLAAHLDAMRQAMRKAAANLEFEEAARLRDEVRRLEAVELAIADDPLARQSEVEAAVEGAVQRGGRSTGGRAGMHGGKKGGRRR